MGKYSGISVKYDGIWEKYSGIWGNNSGRLQWYLGQIPFYLWGGNDIQGKYRGILGEIQGYLG